ncbi:MULTISPECIES: hypothetical protein [unclassified Methanoculleus]|uniref:hypothetical protein n=1 Tax=unclassified Methanoculleus TaxID=2619537 RepID=UPI0025E943F9|nr:MULTISPECIES: hypothetical protein [unclassified Methanoculleus]MCK9318568.1 hypothetical protein [Methanoculleus sp.]MDD2253125.1 hypothetical protein [Methanoculleus sp.]MDD2788322.1 hypothetical protein [Methanoculleus sp.]MDD3216962.1 hypothetical protein [Methanoculleus sp.]MDD4313329.1 hypothetical protein [Methanoculleus sp.]
MTCRTGLLWDRPLMFARLIEDCGACCEAVNPHMLASPFWRGRFVSLIVPTGFGNPDYSNLLPALRAAESRIRRFVENGGRLLVFGAGGPREDAYDWLPFPATYTFSYGPRAVRFTTESDYTSLFSGYDLAAVECDGSFSAHGGETLAVSATGEALLVGKTIGDGVVLLSSIHEYPSREFLKAFACGERETLF